MAHTARRQNDTRRHSVVYAEGTKIGMRVNGKMVTGKVGSIDAGGWIYPSWDSHPGALPSYCRSTHVFPLDENTVPTKGYKIH